MMKTLYAILICMPILALADEEQASTLSRRLTVRTIDCWPATQVVQWIAKCNQMTVQFNDGIDTNAVKLRIVADNLDSSELFDWALRALDANASIAGSVVHLTAGRPPAMTHGVPPAESPALAKPYPQSTSFTNDAQLVLDYVLHFAKHGNAVMEDCPQLRTKVSLEPRGRSTADILEDVCDQAGLKSTLHGKVLFIRKKEDTEVPNQTNGR